MPESSDELLCWIFSVSSSDPLTILQHCALSSERLIFMDHISGLPCSLTSSWVQPMGSTNRRSEGGRRVRLGCSFTGSHPLELLWAATPSYWRPQFLLRGALPKLPSPGFSHLSNGGNGSPIVEATESVTILSSFSKS